MQRYSLSFEVVIDEPMSEIEVEDQLRDALQDVGMEVQEYVNISELDY